MKWIKWSIAVIIILFCIKQGFEVKGFCISRFSHLDNLYTEQELIDKAILFSRREISKTYRSSDGASEQLKFYSKFLTEFKQFHPNCCKLTKIGPEGYTNPAYVGYIIVIDDDYERSIAYDSCGNLYDRYIY